MRTFTTGSIAQDYFSDTINLMGQYKVQVIRDLCIGAATCVAIAPKAFQLDSEAKAIILPTIGEETDQSLLDAAKSCPVAAIIITDQSGNQVYP